MNRLVILGNGFDIAHSLKTKYSDYISNYWENIEGELDDEFFKLSDFKNIKKGFFKNYKNIIDFALRLGYSSDEPICKNKFFQKLNRIYDETYWVNIEVEYFKELKKILEGSKNENRNFEKIKKLNKEIESISLHFERYLLNNVLPEIEKSYNEKIAEIFLINSIKDKEKFFEEFPKYYVNHELKNNYVNNPNEKFKSTLILNFNYTNTVNLYNKKEKFIVINIHGQVNDLNNTINFGFGDEHDKFYKEIEDANENEYLKYMKSFYYANNNNYKSLFDFIDESPFQTQIMGHSCGLSDRTLLNAIFEHKNCKSIKIFYHKWKNKEKEEDNYTEVVQNISRHFNQKKMMREKIVNKSLCSELPQKNVL